MFDRCFIWCGANKMNTDTVENNTLMEALRQEMIRNEEQRNYIEILKQTIESSLIKSGLNSQIETFMLESKDNFTQKSASKIFE